MGEKNEDNAYEPITEGKEGSKRNPLIIDNADTYHTNITKLPKTAWLTSVKENAGCHFMYQDVLLIIKPNGLINYASQEASEKDRGKLRLDYMKDCFIKSLVEDLQSNR